MTYQEQEGLENARSPEAKLRTTESDLNPESQKSNSIPVIQWMNHY